MNRLEKSPILCLVSSYEFKDTNATKARLGAYVDILSEHFNIFLLCPYGSDLSVTNSAGIINLGCSPARGVFFVRAIRELIYTITAWRKLRHVRPDILLVSSPSMFLLLLAFQRNCPIILDIRDLTWEYLSDSNVMSRAIKSMFRVFFTSAIRDADMVWVTNEWEQRYVERIIKSKRAHIQLRIVRNGISENRFESIRKISDKRDKKNPLLLYVGNIGLAQNLTTLIDVAVQFPNIRVLIIGEGSDLERVKLLAARKLVGNVSFVGGIPWRRVNEYYSEASILYAQITAGYATAIPSKLYEYLTVGVPIIYGGSGVAAEFLTQFDGVHVVEPENKIALAKVIASLLNEIDTDKYSRNIELIHSKYQRENQVRAVCNTVVELCSRNNF
jgi:glycosyltransferase involved in cell wall biosynthesis